jgi:hypothetical protein
VKQLIPILLFFTITANSLRAQSLKQTEDSLKNYFNSIKDKTDPIEGFWEVASVEEYYHYDTLYNVVKTSKPSRVAIIKKEDTCHVFNLSGELFNVEFVSTDVKNVYLYRIYFSGIKKHSEAQAIINKSGSMEATYEIPVSDNTNEADNTIKKDMRKVMVSKWTKIN